MKFIRTVLTGLYLLMMVLIPRAHMIGHGGEASSSVEQACPGHDHHDESSDESRDDSHDHESCSLCQLLTVFADTPATLELVESCGDLVEIVERPASIHLPSVRLFKQARAPPFMTA